MKIRITESQYKRLLTEQTTEDIYVEGYKTTGDTRTVEIYLSNGDKVTGDINGKCDPSTDSLEYCGSDCIRFNCVINFSYKDGHYEIDHSKIKEMEKKPYLHLFKL